MRNPFFWDFTSSSVEIMAPVVSRLKVSKTERRVLPLNLYVREAPPEAVRDAVRRLGELGSPSGVLARAATEFGTDSQFDRLIISEVSGGRFQPRTVWDRELAEAEVPIFLISTFETDYVLVRSSDLARAVDALEDAGHVFAA